MKRVLVFAFVAAVLGASLSAAPQNSEGRIVEARNALEAVRKSVGEGDVRFAAELVKLGDAYWKSFTSLAADMAYQRALSLYQRILPPDDVRIADLLLRLASLSGIYNGRAGELLARRALDIYVKQLPPDDGAMREARFSVAQHLVRQGKYLEAEPLLVEAIDHLEKTSDRNLSLALTNYEVVLQSTGRFAEAREAHARSQAAFNALLERTP